MRYKEKTLELCDGPDKVQNLRSRRFRWARHMVRMGRKEFRLGQYFVNWKGMVTAALGPRCGQ